MKKPETEKSTSPITVIVPQSHKEALFRQADGAPWIWDAIFPEFSGKARENLDIFHALFGKETAEYFWWYETMKRDLLDGGVAPLWDRVDRMATLGAVLSGEQRKDYWKKHCLGGLQ